MKVVVLALALSLGTVTTAFAQAPTLNLASPRLTASFEPPKMQAAAGEKPGFTVFGNLGLGLQHDTYYEETAVGLAGSNFGVGMFVTNRLAVLGRLSFTIAQFDDLFTPTSQVSGVLGGSVQYWLNDRFSIEGGAGMGFWANDAAGFEASDQAFGIIAAVAGSVYKRGRHHVRISFEYAPAFTDIAVHNIGFTVGYQLVK